MPPQLLLAALVLDAARLLGGDSSLVQTLATSAELARAVVEVAGGPALLLDPAGGPMEQRAMMALQLQCFEWLAQDGMYRCIAVCITLYTDAIGG